MFIIKKSNIFYFVALSVSLIGYVINIFNYLTIKNSITLSGAGNIQLYVYLAIIIAIPPLFILSIWLMIKSVRNNQEVSTVSIVLLMINLIFMFGLFSYATVSNFHDYYEQYTNLINSSSVSEEAIKVYKVSRTNLIYSLLGGFILPGTYLVASVLALIFKVKETRRVE